VGTPNPRQGRTPAPHLSPNLSFDPHLAKPTVDLLLVLEPYNPGRMC